MLFWLSLGLFVLLFVAWLAVRYVPNDCAAIVEKLWSPSGSVPEGRIIALDGEAGYQAELLRGGVHFGYWRGQYRIHKVRLVTIGQGKIGYVYARDGESLTSSQTLARVAPSNNFQDARMFLGGDGSASAVKGQRGPPAGDSCAKASTRSTWRCLSSLPKTRCMRCGICSIGRRRRRRTNGARSWRRSAGLIRWSLAAPIETADPLEPEMTRSVDSIAIVTTHDGPSLSPGEIIAPAVGTEPADENYHNNYQDPEAFLRGGGRRGRQYVPLTDGTYFINRWFASIEPIPKTVVPIGYVGVVVSYYGRQGQDLSGTAFRHGERVSEGERGVWERPLGPGKYPFNTFAGTIILVPTTNFVLHWVTGRTEAHRYDESLKSIDLVTRDAYEPLLPLSVVVHIDYQRAPSVIQRFGDIKRLITQTLDPMLSAFFRDVAHKKTMLELLHDRDVIQNEAREVLRKRFREFDIECVDVLIGKPDSQKGDTKIENAARTTAAAAIVGRADRNLRAPAGGGREAANLERGAGAGADADGADEHARAGADRRKPGRGRFGSRPQAGGAGRRDGRGGAGQGAEAGRANRGDGRGRLEAARAGRRGEAQKIAQVGFTEAAVLLRRIASYRDPKLYAMSLLAEQLSKSSSRWCRSACLWPAAADGGNGGRLESDGGLVRDAAGFARGREIGLCDGQGGPGAGRHGGLPIE